MAYDLIRGFTDPTNWSRGAETIGSVGAAEEDKTKRTMVLAALAGVGVVAGWLFWQGRRGSRPRPRVGGTLVMMNRSPSGRITSGI